MNSLNNLVRNIFRAHDIAGLQHSKICDLVAKYKNLSLKEPMIILINCD